MVQLLLLFSLQSVVSIQGMLGEDDIKAIVEFGRRIFFHFQYSLLIVVLLKKIYCLFINTRFLNQMKPVMEYCVWVGSMQGLNTVYGLDQPVQFPAQFSNPLHHPI